jgi:hypothetical protein
MGGSAQNFSWKNKGREIASLTGLLKKFRQFAASGSHRDLQGMLTVKLSMDAEYVLNQLDEDLV